MTIHPTADLLARGQGRPLLLVYQEGIYTFSALCRPNSSGVRIGIRGLGAEVKVHSTDSHVHGG